MKKRIMEVFVCMLLIGTCFVVTLDTVSADQEGDYTYSVINGEATLWGYTGTGGAITIPSTLGGYPTGIIGDSTFAHNKGITSVIIPDSVKTIRGHAFSGSSLVSVTFGNGVTTIEDSAFYQCNSLRSVTIPGSVTTFGNGVFSSCHSLTSATIGNGITTIGNSLFKDCVNLTTVTIPESVITIQGEAFYGCYALTSITIPDSVTTIGNNAFFSCKSLTSMNIPNSVTTIGNGAFYYCRAMTSITIPDSVTTIGSVSFYNCDSLPSVTIGNNVTSIGSNAFIECDVLASVTFGKSVTTIGGNSFQYCVSLISITFLGLVAPTTVGDNWISGTPQEIRGHAYANSNFPAPGEVWHGLTMGEYIGEENEPPVASFTWVPSAPKANQTVTFDASASNDPDGSITTYEWDWNNDGTYDDFKTTPTATHSWSQAGSYPIKLQVTDNGGLTSTKTLSVTVSSEGGGGNGDTDDKGTPGFELVFLIGAIAVVLFLWRKKRIV